MNPSRIASLSMLALLLLLEGCATRPVNPPLTQAGLDQDVGAIVVADPATGGGAAAKAP